ncbi:MAG: carboxypeptidase-like regulatory domain-containing protein [Bacteroidales bacterium]|nr:carboxypeptidase-like regulatory domain-containing protein [Bacteroidales bacterium]
MKKSIFVVVLFLVKVSFLLGQGVIKGTVVDAQTGESLIGCNVYIQGTTQGVTTDLDGNFVIRNVKPGKYTLVASYVSYDNKTLEVQVPSTGEVNVSISLSPATITISEVNVVAKKRYDTEMSMLNTIKSKEVIISGISNQQIQKSQDKDAAEVLRRVPGITITDGRFVVIRGLYERYNSVLLNGVTAPSSEADQRAFSFDLIPSGMIDNIIVYKSPAPELPADFAGSAINIATKNTAEENSFSFSYTAGYTQQTTFKNFVSYPGGKFDWLGLDDGTRNIPKIFPSKNQMNDSVFFYDYLPEYRDSITRISKSFRNNAFIPQSFKAPINQSANVAFNRVFKFGDNVRGASFTSILYSNSYVNQDAKRAEYLDPNPITGEESYLFDFRDDRYNNNIRASLLQNFSLSFSPNHTIEWRNFVTINTLNRTVVRDGMDYTSSQIDTVRAYAMEFYERTAYTGQLAGKSSFNDKNTEIDWVYGYSYANKSQPDMKRLYFFKTDDGTGQYKYRLSFASSLPVPERGGRFYIFAYENIHNAGLNLTQNIILGSKTYTIKTGAYYELRNRVFDARNIGIVTKGALSVNLFQPLDSVFQNDNFFYPGGLVYNENTKSSNHYRAHVQSIAPYVGIKIPIGSKISTYSGIRYENYYRLIADFQKNKNLIPDRTYRSNDIFLSTNITYSFNEKNLLRFSYGNTINRPEFREVSQFYYTDFDLNAGVWGNDSLKDCQIQNYDLRYELYPSTEEIISLSLFYKHFKNPIETSLIESGNQPEYKPFNSEQAFSQGIELDVRKSFISLASQDNLLQYFKNFTLVMNASLIKSKVKTEWADAREKEREMMGQSPYIINVGLYYSSEKSRLRITSLYNRAGRRLVAIGTKNNPHTWELSRNAVDLTVSKGFGRGLEVKLGIKDLLNEPVQRVQYDVVKNSSSGITKELTETTLYYKPGTQVSLGISFKF